MSRKLIKLYGDGYFLSNDIKAGDYLDIKKVDSSARCCTVYAEKGKCLEGVLEGDYTLSTQFESVTIVKDDDGHYWIV